MALDAGQIAELRSWIGTEPDDATLDASYDRLGTLEDVALEVLRARRAEMVLDGPAKLDITGDRNEDWSANLNALNKDIATLTGPGGGTAASGTQAVSTLPLRRDGYTGRR